MTRFFAAAAVAAALGLGTASTADAQYITSYGRVTPNGGVVYNNSYSNGFSTQTYQSYYSPYGGYNQRAYYGDVFGNTAGRSYGVNPYYGGYNRGFYSPNPYVSPFGGYNYNFYRRW